MTKVAWGVALGAAAMLGACTGGTTDRRSEGFDSYAELADYQADLSADADAAAPVATGDLPDDGSAVYQGVMNITVAEGTPTSIDPDVTWRAVGGLDLDVDFGTGVVSGDADNFYLDNGTDAGVAVEGELEIGDARPGELDGDPGFEGQISGEVNGTDLSGGIGGNFSGETSDGDPRYASGTLGGYAEGEVPSFFYGDFVVRNKDL